MSHTDGSRYAFDRARRDATRSNDLSFIYNFTYEILG